VARIPTSSVPEHRMQIRGIRHEIKMIRKKKVTRWIGLQGDKYVTLPSGWVELNFDPMILKEATERAERNLSEKKIAPRFLIIPPGDCREDHPPMDIRHRQGLNYYYQGKVENCVMGGLANAVFWMMGPDECNQLLGNFHPSPLFFWRDFQQHVSSVLKQYDLVTFQCKNVLDMDDSCPVVIQLRCGHKSESHAICIYKGCIYDSASQFVLKKNQAALNWSCGEGGFETHLRLYRLKHRDVKQTVPKKRKATRSRRTKYV
jgi:hypothetical protein